VPDANSAVVGEYSLLSDSVESRYEYATFRHLSNISTSADLARYLLETYNDRTHHVRFGAYALDDFIDISLLLNWEQLRDDAGEISELWDALNVSWELGLQSAVDWNMSALDLATKFYNVTSYSPNTTADLVSQLCCL
jgi:hypothetical protein